MTITAARLLADLGLLDADPAEAATAILRFCEHWDRAIGRRCLTHLPTREARHLTHLAKSHPTPTVQLFLRTRIPALHQIVGEEYDRTLREWLHSSSN